MSERAEFEAMLNTTQVQTSLDAVRSKQDALIGSGGRLEGILGNVESAMKRGAGQLAAFAKAHIDTSNAMGMVAAGGAEIAQGFAMGGPVGGAIAGATVLVENLTRAWEKELKAQDEALTKNFAATDATGSAMNKAKDDVLALRQKLSEQGLSQSEVQVAATNREIAAIKAKIGALVDLRSVNGAPGDEEKQLRATVAALYEKEKLLKQIDKINAPAPGAKVNAPEVDLETSIQMWLSKIHDEAVAHRTATDIEGFEAKKKLELDRIKLETASYTISRQEAEKAAAEEEALLRKQDEANKQAMEAQMARLDQAYGAGFDAILGGAESSIFGFLEATKEGQKDAAQQATASFLKSTGEQLVGLGLKNVLEGAALTFAGDPAGAGIAGIGAAELALGGAMGATGIAIAPAAASARGGGALSRAATDRGVNQGGGRGGSGSGSGPTTVVINNSYSAIVAAAPQDQGREVERVRNARTRSAGLDGPRR